MRLQLTVRGILKLIVVAASIFATWNMTSLKLSPPTVRLSCRDASSAARSINSYIVFNHAKSRLARLLPRGSDIFAGLSVHRHSDGASLLIIERDTGSRYEDACVANAIAEAVVETNRPGAVRIHSIASAGDIGTMTNRWKAGDRLFAATVAGVAMALVIAAPRWLLALIDRKKHRISNFQRLIQAAASVPA